MQVKLVAYTKPVAELEDAGIESVQDFIAYCARVSNPSNQVNNDTSERLLAYLKKYAHWSPFEMASVTMEIVTTRDIARQILRHRSFSFQEFSQRYADPTETLEFEFRECRLQDYKNRQNSIDLNLESEEDRVLSDIWHIKQAAVLAAVREAYTWARSNNIAKEVARCVLPEGMTESRLYMSGTVRSWIHYVALRSENGTQKEHMDIAKEAGQVLAALIPSIATDIKGVK